MTTNNHAIEQRDSGAVKIKSQCLSSLHHNYKLILKSPLSLIIKSKSLFEILLHKTRCSPGPSLASLGFHFSRCRDTHSGSVSLSASFFLLSGLLYKSQLAGPWCTWGLTQESYFCPSLPLYDQNLLGCCDHQPVTHHSPSSPSPSLNHGSGRGSAGEKRKWGQNGRGKNNSLFIAHLHHQQKSLSFFVWGETQHHWSRAAAASPGPASSSDTHANN